MRTYCGLANEPNPFLDQGLTRLVGRVGLAGDDELHRALRIGQQPQAAAPDRAAAGWAVCRWQNAAQNPASRHSDRTDAWRAPRLRRRAGDGKFPGQPFAGVFNERLAAGGAKLPEPGVGNTANVLLQRFRRPQPAVLSAGLRPKIVGRRRVPSRHVDTVGDVPDGHFVLRPARKKGAKMCRLTCPCKRLTPLTDPLPRMAR